MTKDHKYDREKDRQAVLDDYKRRMIDLFTADIPLPGVEWDAEPVRYFKLNKKWCIVLSGWLDIMQDVAFWREAAGEDYAGIQAILAFEEGIELPEVGDFDCEDVEDCLESSEIIADLNQQIIDLTEKVKELEHEADNGGSPLPDNPDMADSGDSVCRGANFIAQRLSDALADYWDQAASLTLEEFVSALLSAASIGFIPATSFWQFVFTLSSPGLKDDALEHVDDIAQAFFCANWEIEAAKDRINEDPDLTTNEKALWIVTIELYRQGQIDEWGHVGTLSESDYDCTGGCPWVVVWDFDGSYVPIGDEDAIYTGNTWEVSGGNYFGDQGYVGNNDVWQIRKDLPEQCKVGPWVHRVNKNVLCLAVDIAVTWRGISGTDPESFSPEGRVLNNPDDPYSQFWGGIPAVLSEMKIRHDHFFCGGDHYGSQTRWVRMTGTGVMPPD